MNQAGYLYRLQIVDSQLDQIHTRLNQIERAIQEDQRLTQAKQSLEEAAHAKEISRQALRSIEYTVAEQQIKIEQTESTLYSGRVKNPKELQDLQLELTSLKKLLKTLEDRQLDAMIQFEEAESLLATARASFERTQAQVIEEKAGLMGEKDQLLAREKNLEAERQAILPSITPENYQIYLQVRQQKNGIAVSKVEEEACSACGAPIRPSEAQNARLQSRLFYCASCGRILYAG